MPNTENLKRSALVLSLLLAACAHAPQQVAAPPSDRDLAAQASPHPSVEPQPDIPKLELSGDMLYDFLLGEVAGQRGDTELSTRIYQELAAETRDPRVARRAAQLAFDARQMEKAVDALNLWLELNPASRQARQLLITALLSGGKLEEARPHLAEMLASNPEQAGHTFTQTYALLTRHPDKNAVLELLHDLAQPYPKVPEGHLVQAQAAILAGNRERALEETRKASALQPGWETAVLLEAQLLRQESSQRALGMLKDYLADYPRAGEVRLLYARLLLEQRKFPEAHTEFRRLLNEHPESPDLAFTVAMLSLEMGKLDEAEDELRQTLARGKNDESTVYYYLGQLNEAKKNSEEALQNYLQVESGEYAYTSRLRAAYLMYKTGRLEEARSYLHQTDAGNNQQRVQLLSVEAQMLREAKQAEAAYQVLIQGLDSLPNQPDLLFQAAMMAEMLGKHDEFERMMRKVIEVKPDHAQAYNALGYSLLDRNERIQEGMQLVEKAIQLAPDDAGIIDSVAWGHYRLGNLDKSLELLRRAYSTNPDPEIAAHLGEVLWMQGVKSEAKKVWDEALKTHPDNSVLQDTVKRLQP